MEKIFAYGTLRLPDIQKKVFGRVIESKSDRLAGWSKASIDIEGETYPLAVRDERGNIEGQVIELTPEQLRAADEYETDAYSRITVALRSGDSAWMYVARTVKNA